MIALWITILGSSLAGSLHCVAMCGPLIGLSRGRHSLSLALIHALGRLTTYAALGALAGVVAARSISPGAWRQSSMSRRSPPAP